MKFWYLFLIIFFLFSCNSLPEIKSLNSLERNDLSKQCKLVFVNKKIRIIQSVNAKLFTGDSSSFIGVLVLDPVSKGIHCVMMSIEGFVFFDAYYYKKIKINRAVSPFDSKYFALGLMKDISLIFFNPDNIDYKQYGNLSDGRKVCRYIRKDKSVIDVIMSSEKKWQIKNYNSGNSLIKDVKAYRDVKYEIPHLIELRKNGMFGYELKFKLIESELVK